MGCTPSSCTTIATVGSEITPHKLKSEKSPRSFKISKSSGSSSESKSSKKKSLKPRKSKNVFYGSHDNLETPHWDDHTDWETRDLQLGDGDAVSDVSDVTLQETDADSDSDATLEADFGEDADQLLGAGRTDSKWTVTVHLYNEKTNSGTNVVPNVEVCQQQTRESQGSSKNRLSLKRRTSKEISKRYAKADIQNPAFAWVGDSASAYKKSQGQVQDQGQIQGQESQQENANSQAETNNQISRTNDQEQKNHSQTDPKAERELMTLRANFIPVRSTGDEEEDTWHSLCDSTTALDAQSRCDSREDDFDDNLSMATSLDADSIMTDYLDSDIIEDFSGSTHSLNTLSSAKALHINTNITTTSTTESRTSPESGFVNGTSTSSVLFTKSMRDIPESIAESATRPTRAAISSAATNTTNPRLRPKAAGRQRSVKRDIITR